MVDRQLHYAVASELEMLKQLLQTKSEQVSGTNGYSEASLQIEDLETEIKSLAASNLAKNEDEFIFDWLTRWVVAKVPHCDMLYQNLQKSRIDDEALRHVFLLAIKKCINLPQKRCANIESLGKVNRTA
eukprot:Gregarina_sp_Poly_1__804@NODE_1192_length_4819_cov_79_115320_g819_i0_p6_GENE_NODE_1192_length_4819_cov_79_115320_g819_i0NODE_1192_length_4819_cov_79_115320_g819_i0_p6_ORF_typecomplete_len129_score19_08HHH_8/PF14716_6/0_01DUF2524/PF10732_9/0_043_NODE_1192_length_4819_cov_79_115320_g819_i017912177